MIERPVVHGADEDARYDKERRFHDALVEAGRSRDAGRFYAINRSSWTFYKSLLICEAERATKSGACDILEYGSGSGSYASSALAGAGYPSIGIDLDLRRSYAEFPRSCDRTEARSSASRSGTTPSSICVAVSHRTSAPKTTTPCS